MGSTTAQQQRRRRAAHVVLVPFPAHGHVAPQVQLARALNARGVHATLVHTELHHLRLLRTSKQQPTPPATTEDEGGSFAVEVIPDGLSLDDPPRTLRAHHEAMERNCLEPFKALLRRLLGGGGNSSVVVVADTAMPFAAVAARQVGVPDVQFFTASACGLMGYLHFPELMARGLVPLKSPAYETDGSLDAPLDWVPGMMTTKSGAAPLRLRDMPTFCRATGADGDDDDDHWLLHFHVHQMKVAAASKAVILNTFYDMDSDVVDALAPLLPPIYTVGPLASVTEPAVAAGLLQLQEEDRECMAWLDGKAPRSVVYFSVGSHASMGGAQLREIASGLARCGSPYLWVLRPEMAAAVAEEVGGGGGGDGDEGLVVPWCAQEAVLSHPAVGLFVTHCGWNSILETVVAGVPVLGCPVISEQTTNCRQVRVAWGIGDELPQGARGDEIAALVREMMTRRKGKEARDKTLHWKKLAQVSAREGGSSYDNIARLVDNVLLHE